MFASVGLLMFASFCFAAKVNNDSNKTGSIGNGNNGFSYPIILKSIAILPLENFTDDPVASTKTSHYIKRQLKGKGWVLITGDELVEKFLAKRRIRYTGAVTRATVREMGKVMGVDAVLVGSVNQYKQVNDVVVVGVSARLVSTLDGSVIWADSLTYTGKDFQGFLGLGTIYSLEVLSEVVIKDMVRSIADTFFIRTADLSPFEIDKVVAYPVVSKAGQEIELRINLLPILDEPSGVKAVIEGIEVELKRVREGVYEGYVTAPDSEGVHMIDIVAKDMEMVPFVFEAAGKIVVDNTPPRISLDVDRKIFSTRNRSAFVTFTPRLISLEEIDEWKIEIFNSEGKRIRGDKGFGKLPKRLIWRGDTEKRGMADEGEYSFRFTVQDHAGNKTTIKDVLRIKNSPPVINIDVDLSEDDSIIFTFNYNEDENIESWKLTILDRDGSTLKVMEGEGDVPNVLEYPIDEESDLRRMAFTVNATDTAGNVFVLKKTIPSYLSKKIPFAKLRGKGLVTEDF